MTHPENSPGATPLAPFLPAEDATLYRRLFWLAAATYLITLFSVQCTGEEAVYTVGAIEMWFQGHMLTASSYGETYWRPPLFNWLIVLFTLPLGWDHVLLAARLVSAVATVGSGLLLGFTVCRIWKSPAFGALAALVFLTFWETLFYYGWLAYSDAIFSFFCLAAMLLAWLAVRERKWHWLALALAAAAAGSLTKALTVFIFYGVALLGALLRDRAWSMLKSPWFWILHGLSLAPLMGWNALTHHGSAHPATMVADVTGKLQALGLADYLSQLAAFPTRMVYNLLPWGLLVLWMAWRERKNPPAWCTPDVMLAGGIALVNFLPYWFAPQSAHRYVLPIYGLIAIVVAARLAARPDVRRLVLRWTTGILILKVLVAAVIFPAYTHKFRPDLDAIARDVLALTRDKPLYSMDGTWVGFGVATKLDVARLPAPPILLATDAVRDGFILAEAPDPKVGTLVREYQGTALHCRGGACEGLKLPLPSMDRSR